jgi:serine/threonine protein kinase
MSNALPESSSTPELDEVIADYIQQVEAGRSPDQADLLQRYPHLARKLAEYFAAERRVGAWAHEPTFVPSTPFVPSTDDDRPDAPPQDAAGVEPDFAKVVPGTVLAGQYRVIDVKAGGMGRVYLAEDLRARERGTILNVALKTVPDYAEWRRRRLQKGAPDGPAEYANLLARFHREALAWVRLGSHHNIVFAGYVLTIGGRPHLWLEHIDGGDLADWISEGGLTIARSVNYALQFCAGMQHAVRTAGMVHRDIKPSNVLIKDGRIVKITDFGLSRAYGSGDRSAEEGAGDDNSATGSSVRRGGTRSYMPPEQFLSLASADTRSDIFSFGVMLFEMLTRRKLFSAKDACQMFHDRAPLPYACEFNAEVPGALSDLVRRCVQYLPQDRYQSFDELTHDLQQINDALPDRLPIPRDPKVIPAEKLTPSIRAEGETYSLISLGHFEEAARRAQDGIDIDPGKLEHWVNRGTALMELSDFTGARECYRRATQLARGDARSWSNLGWAELALERPEAGLAAASTALRRNAEFAEAWMCRGCCERALGRLQDAVRSLERAAELEPHNWKIHANLGTVLAQSGRSGEALESFAKSAEMNSGDAAVWRQLGWCYAQEQRWTESRTALDRSLALDPENKDTAALRALVMRSQSQAKTIQQRGGLGEPYCNDHCYSAAGKDIALANLQGYEGPCGFCQTPVRLGDGSGSLAHPFRGVFLYVCPGCRSQAQSHAAGIQECCFCQTRLFDSAGHLPQQPT